MTYVLLIFVLWGGQSYTAQVPLANKNLCEAAASQFAGDVIQVGHTQHAMKDVNDADSPRAFSSCVQTTP